MSETLPWTRQKGERSKAFNLFCIYRDLGINRSLELVDEKCREDVGEMSVDSISLRQLERLSSI